MTELTQTAMSPGRALHNLALAFLATDVALIALHLLTESAAFNLDTEANLPTWYSSVKLLGVAILSAALAMRTVDGSRVWGLHAVLFLTLSADEAASFHETLARRLLELPMLGGLQARLTGGDAFKNSYAWVWLFAPAIVAVSIFMLWSVLRRLRRRGGSAAAYVTGLGLLLTAVALEASVSAFPAVTEWGAEEAARYRSLTGFEESAELLGVTLIFAAITRCFRAAAAHSQHGSRDG